MRLFHARRTSNGRIETREPAAGTTAARIFAQQIANHLAQSDTRKYHETLCDDPEKLYRLGLAQRESLEPANSYHVRKYESSEHAAGAEQ